MGDILWLPLRLLAAAVLVLRQVAHLATWVLRVAWRIAATALLLVIFPVRTSRRVSGSARENGYQALRRIVMKAHRPLLLEDYTRRAVALIRERLDPDGGWYVAEGNIFHAHDLNTLVAAHTLAVSTDSPLVYDSHELHSEASAAKRMGSIGRWWHRRYEGYYIRRATRTITVCESLSTIIAARYAVDAPTVVRNTPERPLALVESPPPLRTELGIPAHQRIALYHGNIAAFRGLEALVDAAADMDDVAVVFIGDGILRPELEARSAAQGLSDRVYFRDAVPGTLLQHYIRSADVGVIPIQAHILNYYFSLPNKLFELMMAGRPVVAADLPEIRRVVEQYEIGDIFPLEDSAGIARAITGVLNRPDYDELCSRASAGARDNSWERESMLLAQLYETMPTATAWETPRRRLLSRTGERSHGTRR